MSNSRSKVYFASAVPEKLDRNLTLPARFSRLLESMPIQERVKGKTVAIKMHLGNDLSYSTIHPLFVRMLVDHVKKARPKKVFITDVNTSTHPTRGYTPETTGAKIINALGAKGDDFKRKRIPWKHIKSALVSRAVLDADVLINLSHFKGHGDCGFGGACKNLAMGCVPGETRRDMHSLEGDLKWSKGKCIRCDKCIKECPTNANTFTEAGDYEIFWHHCLMCQHCMLVCPTNAIKLTNRNFKLFQQGMARVAKVVVDSFKKGNTFHINVLTHITIFCDCWGMTTPALVPDVGIFGSEDIVAVDHASLKGVKTSNLIPGSITPPFKLGKKGRHLFEKIHARDPFLQPAEMEKLGMGSTKYDLVKVK